MISRTYYYVYVCFSYYVNDISISLKFIRSHGTMISRLSMLALIHEIPEWTNMDLEAFTAGLFMKHFL